MMPGMEVPERFLLAAAIVLTCLLTQHQTYSCNEALCAPVVSKCMLTQSCKCEMTIKSECTCCKECFTCLGDKYTDCCSCVGICPKKNETKAVGDPSKQSSVEDFSEDYTELFSLFANHPDDRWVSLTYPVEIDISSYSPKVNKDITYQTLDKFKQKVNHAKDNMVILNCTVLFQKQCMSYIKCRETCLSMGASSVRWFHDGCCECVGEFCINYGINESRCPMCSNEHLDVDKNDLTYDTEDLGEVEGKEMDYEEAVGQKENFDDEEEANKKSNF